MIRVPTGKLQFSPSYLSVDIGVGLYIASTYVPSSCMQELALAESAAR